MMEPANLQASVAYLQIDADKVDAVVRNWQIKTGRKNRDNPNRDKILFTLYRMGNSHWYLRPMHRGASNDALITMLTPILDLRLVVKDVKPLFGPTLSLVEE